MTCFGWKMMSMNILGGAAVVCAIMMISVGSCCVSGIVTSFSWLVCVFSWTVLSTLMDVLGLFPSLLVLLVSLQSPQSVHSQLNTCEGTEPSRFNCTAQQCLNCTHVPTTCTHDNETDSVDCWADTSLCRIQWCPPCSQCTASYIKQRGSKFSDWEMSSYCFGVSTHGNNTSCTANEITPRCIVEEKNTLFLDVNNVSEKKVVSCNCFEENCTQSLQFLVKILPPTLSPPPTLTTAQSMDTPTVISLEVALALLGGILVFIIIIIVIMLGVYCGHKVLKNHHPARSRRPGQTGIDNNLNDQPWQLLGQIGHGRYGFVYKALYEDEVVAIKIFNHNSRNSWENETNLFAMESTMHKNIIEYFTSESKGSGIQLQFFMITRYYPLGSLNQYLKGKVVSWEQACRMIQSIVCGLAHLHSERYTNQSGIIAEKYSVAHRDLKSANILVSNESGVCVIADLGFAMILDPSAGVKELANTGQVGTFRYMAPEALDARVHLQDVQCFKQIDVYALALVMWEVVSRCCVLTEEDLPPYQLPYEDVAGLRPSLDVMKDIVAVRKLRPSLPAIWGNHELLNSLQETIHECWDGDPEARLPAANVLHRIEDLSNTSLDFFEQTSNISNTQSHQHMSATVTMYNDNVSNVEIGRPTEHSQSSPPPYYSPLDPISDQQHCDSFPVSYHMPFPTSLFQSQRQQRPYFQSSMPHIMQNDQERLCGASSGADNELTPRCSMSLRSSRVVEIQGLPLNNLKPNSVRNSLILSVEERETSLGRLEDSPGLTSGSSVSSLSNESLQVQRTNDSGMNNNLGVAYAHNDDLQFEQRLTAESLISNGSELDSNLNSDSGIQNLRSVSECEELSDCEEDLIAAQNNGDICMSSTDVLSFGNENVCEVNPPITNSSSVVLTPTYTSLPVENSGNSVVTVTSV